MGKKARRAKMAQAKKKSAQDNLKRGKTSVATGAVVEKPCHHWHSIKPDQLKKLLQSKFPNKSVPRRCMDCAAGNSEAASSSACGVEDAVADAVSKLSLTAAERRADEDGEGGTPSGAVDEEEQAPNGPREVTNGCSEEDSEKDCEEGGPGKDAEDGPGKDAEGGPGKDAEDGPGKDAEGGPSRDSGEVAEAVTEQHHEEGGVVNGVGKEGGEGKAVDSQDKGDPSSNVAAEQRPLWLCLMCGHVACGRTADMHAAQHAEDSKHALAVQVFVDSTGKRPSMAWCYQDDSEVNLLKVLSKRVAKELTPVLTRVSVTLAPESARPSGGRKKGKSAADLMAEIRVDGFEPTDDTYIDLPKRTALRVVGLANTGNTCFFNSVLQNLVHLPHIQHTFLKRSLPGGAITNAFSNVLAAVAGGGSACVNPRSLLSLIAERAPRFRGSQQQDSHELLRYLVDGLRWEQVLVSRKRRQAADAKAEEGAPSPVVPWVDLVFGGVVSNTVTCHECKTTSTTYEQFHDVSLALPPVAWVAGDQPSKKKNNNKGGGGGAAVSNPFAALAAGNGGGGGGGGKKLSKHEKKLKRMAEAEAAKETADVPATVAKKGEEARADPDKKTTGGNGTAGMFPSMSLQGCLEEFTAPEELSGREAYVCLECTRRRMRKNQDDEDGCEPVLTDATKQFRFASLPRVLCCHVKRFQQNAKGQVRKVSSYVPFPLSLDMTPFCVSEKGRKAAEEGDEVPRDNTGAAVHFSARDSAQYRLNGVVCHSGGLGGGHYISYVLQKDGEWAHVSDSSVSSTSESRVLASEAYILFYVRDIPSDESAVAVDVSS